MPITDVYIQHCSSCGLKYLWNADITRLTHGRCNAIGNAANKTYWVANQLTQQQHLLFGVHMQS